MNCLLFRVERNREVDMCQNNSGSMYGVCQNNGSMCADSSSLVLSLLSEGGRNSVIFSPIVVHSRMKFCTVES